MIQFGTTSRRSTNRRTRCCARMRPRWRSCWHSVRGLLNHRQLQHGCVLPFAEQRHQHLASIRKFDRVMVPMRNVLVRRAEFSHSEIDLSRPKPSAVVSDVFSECQFRSGQDADRDIGLVCRCKTPCRGAAEGCGGQGLSHLRGARCNGVQTVVTHRIAPRSR